MITICCIKTGNKYGSEYVNVLHSMVQRNVQQAKYDFVCFTDDREGIDHSRIRCEHLLCPYPGWWQKLGLFLPTLEGVHTEKILFIDLDTVITGELDRIINFPSDFAIAQDWPPETLNGRKQHYLSAVFLLKVGSQPQVWFRFNMDCVTADMWGDQIWIESQAPGADFFPYDWMPSYKNRRLQEKYPEDSSMVMFHGYPKPPDCEGWVKELWR